MSPGAPVVLCILDGWGHAEPAPGNAIAAARTPVLDALAHEGASCLVAASGAAVGLPDGVMGNSEVGHLTIGAGRVIEQDLVRIDRAIAEGTLAGLPALTRTFEAITAGSGRLHFFGLCSDAGVHSQLAHLEALVHAAAAAGVERQFVHCFTDGRDTPPTSGPRHVARVERLAAEVPGCLVGSVAGRYWAMDRDARWDRVERAFRMLVGRDGSAEGRGAVEVVEAAHSRGVTDEFIEPCLLSENAAVRDGDAVIHFNFRADRARELTRAFTEESFSAFDAGRRPRLATYATMTRYSRDFDLPVLFPPEVPRHTLGEVFADAGWAQLRLAETEKYAHVTYFLNGGREEPFPGEERHLVPSPRVATYDETPAMSAAEITDVATRWVAGGGARFLVVNYANADMVGHTGDLDATVAACEVVDQCVGRLLDAVRGAKGVALVTADHGNAERMRDEQGGTVTAHTTSLVPTWILDARNGRDAARRPGSPDLSHLRDDGGLSDVAPTLLRLAGLRVPEDMAAGGLEARS